jgi:12,18-didecarboxysiroheme deacetylase
MIGISKLYCGTVEPSDALRYGRKSGRLPSHLLQFSVDRKPVVVWNMTRRCNLTCSHCYASADCSVPDREMDTQQGRALLRSLADFGCPVVLFSGGEPTMREDLPELAEYAVSLGLRAVISTNGTLIDGAMAQRLKDIKLSYVGISIDGAREHHNLMRRDPNAYDNALAGLRACRDVGLKVGLRHTITSFNCADIDALFDLLERERIPRVCFYHLVSAGRGQEMSDDALNHTATRRVVDHIMDRTADLFAHGNEKEVLTVDNHTDGAYLYLRMLREGNPRAEKVMELLRMNGGNSTGHGIGCVSWDGTVYPDQFWRTKPLGNVLERPFGEIWSDTAGIPLLAQLRDKKSHVTGRCARCRFLDICGGNLRARAEAATGEVWGVDPGCYLTDEEIGIA